MGGGGVVSVQVFSAPVPFFCVIVSSRACGQPPCYRHGRLVIYMSRNSWQHDGVASRWTARTFLIFPVCFFLSDTHFCHTQRVEFISALM